MSEKMMPMVCIELSPGAIIKNKEWNAVYPHRSYMVYDLGLNLVMLEALGVMRGNKMYPKVGEVFTSTHLDWIKVLRVEYYFSEEYPLYVFSTDFNTYNSESMGAWYEELWGKGFTCLNEDGCVSPDGVGSDFLCVLDGGALDDSVKKCYGIQQDLFHMVGYTSYRKHRKSNRVLMVRNMLEKYVGDLSEYNGLVAKRVEE